MVCGGFLASAWLVTQVRLHPDHLYRQVDSELELREPSFLKSTYEGSEGVDMVQSGLFEEAQAFGQAQLQDIINQSGPRFEEYYRNAVEAPLLKSYNEVLLPQLNRNLAQSGFYGTARQEALEQSVQDLLDTMVAGRSRTAIEAQRNQLAGLSLLHSITGMELNLLTQALNPLGTERENEINRLNSLLALATGISPGAMGQGPSTGAQNTQTGMEALTALGVAAILA